ncbi:MAG TPA: hypothetical protein VMV33_17200 [Rhodocyclaceae bacterium]|nr:hypothetical protein [Rhodocyclaceae bacterium]
MVGRVLEQGGAAPLDEMRGRCQEARDLMALKLGDVAAFYDVAPGEDKS